MANPKPAKLESGGVEFCAGFIDEHGIWNNGFSCPRWGGPDEEYCCGGPHQSYCCPEPDPIEPVNFAKHIPLIAGVSAGVLLLIIIIVSCFVCPCCPGRKKKSAKRKETRHASDTPTCSCQHHTTSQANLDPEVLHCGCHALRSQTPAAQRPLADSVEAACITLYENHNANWQTELEQLCELPFDDPPPYTEGRDEVVPDVVEEEENTTQRPAPESSNLCMTTFRPLTSPPVEGRHNRPALDAEQSKRDSGVLVEDLEHPLTDAHSTILALQEIHATLQRSNLTRLKPIPTFSNTSLKSLDT